jgi:hypothetical protein
MDGLSAAALLARLDLALRHEDHADSNHRVDKARTLFDAARCTHGLEDGAGAEPAVADRQIAIHGHQHRNRPQPAAARTAGRVPAGPLQALRSEYSARLGAAQRHAGSVLAMEARTQRVLLVLTDGSPSDVDVHDPHHLVKDAHHAVLQLRAQSLAVHGLMVGRLTPMMHAASSGRVTAASPSRPCSSRTSSLHGTHDLQSDDRCKPQTRAYQSDPETFCTRKRRHRSSPGQTMSAAQGTSIAWQSFKTEPTKHTMELKPRIRPALASARGDLESILNRLPAFGRHWWPNGLTKSEATWNSLPAKKTSC